MLGPRSGKCHPYKMNLASETQEVLHIGSTCNRSAMPFLCLRVITNQYNNPSGLFSSENISSFNNALESKTASVPEKNGRALEQSQSPSGLVIDKESEVHKMPLRKQELREPLKQSTSFSVWQEILESEEEGDPTSPWDSEVLRLPSPKWLRGWEMPRRCPHVTNVFVKLWDCHHHSECYI
ncbi:hypothetical protein QTO34_016956 [Cnephaeus nilssonii]|uniref:Zasp-like motif domain-containing protein n=1 Tax=Cnephaeus nilssonii TaxID=3371016 RepID=A0AA40I3C3_CNENI|nr:hypothetical protein QTO34_016956 [Eptesicus nilssonii]